MNSAAARSSRCIKLFTRIYTIFDAHTKNPCNLRLETLRALQTAVDVSLYLAEASAVCWDPNHVVTEIFTHSHTQPNIFLKNNFVQVSIVMLAPMRLIHISKIYGVVASFLFFPI